MSQIVNCKAVILHVKKHNFFHMFVYAFGKKNKKSIIICQEDEERCQTDLPTIILWLFAYLLLQIFEEAIKDFQEILYGLFVPSDNIFSWKHTHIS